MKKIAILLFLTIQPTFGNDMYWSKTGHRVIGEVAQHYLNNKTKRAINKLLNGESLASVSNFADGIRANRAFSKYNAWHYVNYPTDKKYAEAAPSKGGDVVIGIQKCIEIIKNDDGTREEKEFYLKMLVHLVGDLHQPMHVGRLEDKGGNNIQLQWLGRGTNLHQLWDGNMIESHGMGYMELSNSLPKLLRKQIKAMQQGNVYDWVEESHGVANELYASVGVEKKLGNPYLYKYWGTVERQLQKGGLRLAKVLNELFK